MSYRRRAVNFRCGMYLVDTRSGFRSGCSQLLGAFRERPREQKRRAMVRHHHGDQTCMDYRGYCCDCLPGLGPVSTPAFDLNDCDDFSWSAREKTCRRGGSLSYVLDTVCERHRHQVGRVRVQTATRVNKGVSAVSQRVRVFVAILGNAPCFCGGQRRGQWARAGRSREEGRRS